MSEIDNELEVSEAALDNLIEKFNENEGEVLKYKNNLNAIKSRLKVLDVAYSNVLNDFIDYLLDVRSIEEHEEKAKLAQEYNFNNKLTDEELINALNNFIYQDLVNRISEIAEMVNETNDDDMENIITTIFKNLEDSGNKHMSYQEEIRKISKELYSRMISEKEHALDKNYIIKYISPILIPASRRGVDALNFSSELDGEELEIFLQDVIEQSSELLEYYDDVKKETEQLITYFNELTFKQKDALVVKHLNNINSFIARNQTLFEPREILTYDKLTVNYEELKEKSKKKHLKEFLNIYITLVLQTTIDLEAPFENLPESHEVDYINYFENKLILNEMI